MEGLLLLTLFGSVVWFWISVLIFLIICFASDLKENGYYAFGSLVVVSVVYYFYGDIKALLQFLTLTNISIYFGIGIVVAILKTFFAGRKLNKKLKTLPIERDKNVSKYDQLTKAEAKAEFVEKLESNVTRWWFMWPVSLINWLITDLIKDLSHFIYSRFRKFFEFILDLGIKSDN